MRCVQVENIFGNVIAYVRDFQIHKSGFPHSHCIFFSDKASKTILNNLEFVDTMIKAEVSSESVQVLYFVNLV